MSDGGGFKERMEAGIAAEIAGRPEVRAKYVASFDEGEVPYPIKVALTFRSDGLVGLFSAPDDDVTWRVTDHVAPSGVHYRRLKAITPTIYELSHWLDAVINGVSVLLAWNGHGDTVNTIEWQSVLTADEVDTLLER